jgi:hypothetical protein
MSDRSGFKGRSIERRVKRQKSRVKSHCHVLRENVAEAGLQNVTVIEGAWPEVAIAPHDSPNFQVAYNALLQMGIFPDVQMEDEGHWTPWTSPTPEDALANVKRRLGLPDPNDHDAFLRDLLARRLRREGDAYLWPRAMRSALVNWDVTGNR